MNENTTTDNIDTGPLESLLRDREAARRNLKTIEGFIDHERASLIFQKYGVKVGSIVKARRGRLYRVVEVDSRWFPATPWLTGNPQLKSGAYGTGIHNLFGDWELVDSPAAGRV